MEKKILSPKQKARGFTLIELLTVIAIIGVLASILTVTIAGVRQSAQSARTSSNLRQSVQGILLQGLNNNGILKLVGTQGGISSWLTETELVIGRDSGIREAALNPYHPPFRILPEANEPLSTFGVPMAREFDRASSPANNNPALWNTRFVYLSRIDTPSQYILLADSIRDANPTMETPQSRTAWDDGLSSMVHARHKGRIHTGSADGSVALLSPVEYARLRGKTLGRTSYTIQYFSENGQVLQANWSGD